MSERHPAIDNTEHIKKRFDISVEDGTDEPETITAINHEYLARMRESLGLQRFGAADIPHIADITSGSDVISVPFGVHRNGNSTFSGKERIVNLYPGRITMSEEDAEIAKAWALRQLDHYPKENNYANQHAGVHSLVVRVEWGRDPADPYEVDTEPSGYALFPHFSPRIRQSMLAHRATLGNVMWATMPDHRVADSFEHASALLSTTESMTTSPNGNGGLVLPFMASAEDLPEQWHRQSVLPVKHMEDKSHLISMGLFEQLAHDDEVGFARLEAELEDGKPKVVRGLVGSCAVGLLVYQGSGEQKLKMGKKPLQGTITLQKFRDGLKSYRERRADLMVRDFAPATTLNELGLPLNTADEARFGSSEQMCAIKRYYVGFDSNGQPHVLGGVISSRKRTALIHGANDAVNVIVDPPHSEEYVQAA